MKPIILKNFSVQVTKEQILKRLGYNKFKSNLDKKTNEKISAVINEINITAKCSGCFKLTDIEIYDDIIKFIESDYSIKNEALMNVIKKNNGNSVILLSATIGEEIITKIKKLNESHELEQAVILDAAASELAENTINYIEDKGKLYYRKQGKKSNYRFSPGYKGVELKHQLLFENILHISKIGIKINQYNFLIPEKSITAFLPFKVNIYR
jgi:hypothetical protein